MNRRKRIKKSGIGRRGLVGLTPGRVLTVLGLAAVSACINTPSQLGDSGSGSGIVITGGGDSGGDSGSTSGTGGSSSTNDFKISNVTLTSTGSGTSTTQSFSIFFDSSFNPTVTIPSRCTTTTCSCQLQWTQINDTSGVATSYQRTVLSPITSASIDFFTKCKVPTAFTSEIPDGTQVKIKVVGNPGGTVSINMAAFKLLKGGADAGADFFDESGRSFMNIHRYTCFERNERGMAIFSKMEKFTQSIGTGTQDISGPSATAFCIKKASGAQVGGDDGCTTSGAASSISTSAQSYFYNLFVRSDTKGSFNFSNARYYCPKVKETLQDPINPPRSSGTAFPTTAAWPLDTQFALATRASTDWPIGVEAPSVLGIADDPSTASTTCFPADGSTDTGTTTTGTSTGTTTGTTTSSGGTSGATGNEISNKCLGFARKPNADGSCPYFRDGSGNIRLTFRLRRFVALYPPSFDTNGAVMHQALPADIIYVPDRPVKSGNPLEPYSMLGPKPCNFAYFDHSGVTGAFHYNASNDADDADATTGGDRNLYNLPYPLVPLNSKKNSPDDGSGAPAGWRIPGWVATNDSLWDNKSVDGVMFPNKDWDGHAETDNLAYIQHGVAPSCGTAFPVYHYDTTGAPDKIGIGTSHVGNNLKKINLGGGLWANMKGVQVRPTNSWAPHYTEDTEFQACVPLASPFLDPPLHFMKDSAGNVGWCAEVYPTQLGNVDRVDKGAGSTAIGKVQIFTSGFEKNINSSYVPPVAQAALQNAPMGTACTASHVDDPSTNNKSADHSLGSLALTYDRSESNTQYDAGATCDRTIVVGDDFPTRSPLQAQPAAIEDMLYTDSSYNCTVTFDKNGIRSLNKQVPSEGCCGPDASFPSNSLFNTPLTPTSGPGLGPFAEDHKKAARLEPAVYQVSDPAQTQPPFCTTPNY